MATTAAKREFLRWVYRQEDPSGTLDEMAEAALQAQLSGKSLIGSTGDSHSAQFLVRSGWTPEMTLEMIDWARGLLDHDTIDEALEELPVGKITIYRTNFHQLRSG